METETTAYLSGPGVLIWASLKVPFHSGYRGLCTRGDWVVVSSVQAGVLYVTLEI